MQDHEGKVHEGKGITYAFQCSLFAQECIINA